MQELKDKIKKLGYEEIKDIDDATFVAVSYTHLLYPLCPI